MAILNFPSNPSLDDTYTENGLTWRWNGEAWDFEATVTSVDHGSLTGLADDDHTQYLLVDGSRSATSFDVTNNLIVNGNLGVGVSSPGAILDVDGTGSGVSLKIRNGNSAAGGSAIQELFTYSGAGDFGHNIRTQHSSSTNADNTIDFYLWTTADADNTPGSTKVLTIDGAGDVTVSGDIIVGGTVDGRDIATDGTKLDGIASGAVADHGDLTGLGDDDHTQYLLADGTRSATSLDVVGNATVGDIVIDNGANITGHYTGWIKLGASNTISLGIDRNSIQAFNSTSGTYNTLDINSYGGNIVLNRDAGNTGIGTVTPSEKLDVVGNAEINGNIIVTGTVDGRDVAADGAKLDDLIIVSDTAPSTPSSGDLWYESDTGNFYINYDSQWVGVGVGGDNSLGTDINTTVTTTTDTLAAGDRWKLTQYSNASLVTVTVPTGTFSTGDWFMLQSTGAGGLTLSTTGLTVNGANTTIAQSEGMMVVFTASNTISVFGGTS